KKSGRIHDTRIAMKIAGTATAAIGNPTRFTTGPIAATRPMVRADTGAVARVAPTEATTPSIVRDEPIRRYQAEAHSTPAIAVNENHAPRSSTDSGSIIITITALAPSSASGR